MIKAIHVSCTRMVAQGTYGLSIALVTEVVMSGEDIISFVPLQLSSLQESYKLMEWIKYWRGQSDEVPLTPQYWLRKGQGITGHFNKLEGHKITVTTKEGLFIWILPSAAGEI